MKLRTVLCVAFALLAGGYSFAQKKSKQGYFEIKVYTLKDKSQEDRVDAFLKDAYLPALHKTGIKNVGVFKPVETDTTFGKRIFVLIPYSNLEQFAETSDLLATATFTNGKEYLDAQYTDPPFVRLQSIILRAFPGMPGLGLPSLTSARKDRIYELRSYEGPTEKIYRNKVKMFNDGDEIGLFRRLGFNAVFYADVIAGSRMPNLMYMTTFENQTSHDEKWNAFRQDPQWKQLSSMSEYQHNVSKINIYLLRPVDYSDY
ncbi:MAG TPA: NIPSNAP family protein [Cyclobacteriaceae bacterium]|nr:NIPSNAP family protein [Cyclobacteriaceae bacterium]